MSAALTAVDAATSDPVEAGNARTIERAVVRSREHLCRLRPYEADCRQLALGHLAVYAELLRSRRAA